MRDWSLLSVYVVNCFLASLAEFEFIHCSPPLLTFTFPSLLRWIEFTPIKGKIIQWGRQANEMTALENNFPRWQNLSVSLRLFSSALTYAPRHTN